MNKWTVKKDGLAKAGGPISTFYDDDTIRQMIKAGYKVYVDGKVYRPPKK